jgi:hypothetical protein
VTGPALGRSAAAAAAAGGRRPTRTRARRPSFPRRRSRMHITSVLILAFCVMGEPGVFETSPPKDYRRIQRSFKIHRTSVIVASFHSSSLMLDGGCDEEESDHIDEPELDMNRFSRSISALLAGKTEDELEPQQISACRVFDVEGNKNQLSGSGILSLAGLFYHMLCT